MIVIKEQDAIYFASPLKSQNFYSQVKPDYSAEENGNIWHLNDGLGTIVMANGKNSRIIDLIRYSDIFEVEFTKEGVGRIASKIKALVEDTNCFVSEGRTGVTLCIARGNKGFRISPHGAVFELGEIECVNEIEEITLASYEYCKRIEDVRERVVALYNSISEIGWRQHFPIALISTKDDSFTLLHNK